MWNRSTVFQRWLPVYLGLLLAVGQAVFGQNTTAADSAISTTAVSGDFNRSVISQLPVGSDLNRRYDFFSGTVVQDYRGIDYLHVRGGRGDEVAYTLNGHDIRSDFTGLPVIRLIPEMLAGITLDKSPGSDNISAPAHLEHTMLAGKQRLRLSLRAEGDPFTALNQQRFNSYSYGYHNLLAMVDGHLGLPWLRLSAAVENEHFDDHYRRFWDGFQFSGSIFQADAVSGLSLAELTGENGLDIRPGNIAAASDRRTFNGLLTFDWPSLKVDLIAAVNREKRSLNDRPIEYLFNPERIPEEHRESDLLAISLKKISLIGGVQAQLDFGRLLYRSKTIDPLLGDNIGAYTDTTAAMRFDGYLFSRPGALIANYGKGEEERLQSKINLSKRLGNHRLSVGWRWQQGLHRQYQGNGEFAAWLGRLGPIDRLTKKEQLDILFNGMDLHYGYDLQGQDLNENLDPMDRAPRPIMRSWTISDQWIRNDFQINLELMVNNYQPDHQYFSEVLYLDGYRWLYYVAEGTEPPLDVDRSTRKRLFLPRINILHQLNNSAALNISFGRYAQMPRFADVYFYRSGWFDFNTLWRFGQGTTNSMSDFEIPNAYQASIGLDWKNQNQFLSSSLFYKRSFNYLNSEQIYFSGFTTALVPSLEETGESLAYGIENNVAVKRKNIKIQIQYTYTRATGIDSYARTDFSFRYFFRNYNPSKNKFQPLDYQRRNDLSAILNWQDKTAQSYLAKNLSVNVLFEFNDGHPSRLYRFRAQNLERQYGAILNHGQLAIRYAQNDITYTPWQLNINFGIDKKFSVAGSDLRAFVYVQNLFNRQNVNHVYRTTGRTTDDNVRFELRDSLSEEAFALYTLMNIDHRQHYSAQEGGDLFGRPREIRFGLEAAL